MRLAVEFRQCCPLWSHHILFKTTNMEPKEASLVDSSLFGFQGRVTVGQGGDIQTMDLLKRSSRSGLGSSANVFNCRSRRACLSYRRCLDGNVPQTSLPFPETFELSWNVHRDASIGRLAMIYPYHTCAALPGPSLTASQLRLGTPKITLA